MKKVARVRYQAGWLRGKDYYVIEVTDCNGEWDVYKAFPVKAVQGCEVVSVELMKQVTFLQSEGYKVNFD